MDIGFEDSLKVQYNIVDLIIGDFLKEKKTYCVSRFLGFSEREKHIVDLGFGGSSERERTHCGLRFGGFSEKKHGI